MTSRSPCEIVGPVSCLQDVPALFSQCLSCPQSGQTQPRLDLPYPQSGQGQPRSDLPCLQSGQGQPRSDLPCLQSGQGQPRSDLPCLQSGQGQPRLDLPCPQGGQVRPRSGLPYPVIASNSSMKPEIIDRPLSQNSGSLASSPNGARSSLWCLEPPARSISKYLSVKSSAPFSYME